MFLDVTWLERPKIFISSTMDKNTDAIRKSVSKKLEELKYEIIAFETNSFPYPNDNNSNVIEDTVNAVGKANLFVLILDENFGTCIENESVVQKEYNRAKELNIPTYVFIQEDVWKAYINKSIGENELLKNDDHYNFIKSVSVYKISQYKIAEDCLEHLHEQLLNFLGGSLRFSSKANWLWNENYTRSIETHAKEVWVITPDFTWDYTDPQFRGIVVTNVTERDCIYKYIYLANVENEKKKNEMMRRYKKIFQENKKEISKLEEQVQFLPVKPNKFYWSNEQIIFNPFELNERAIMVDVMDVRDRTLKFNIELGHVKRVFFREQFISYWNTNKKTYVKEIQSSNYS